MDVYVSIHIRLCIGKDSKARTGAFKCTEDVWRESGREKFWERNPCGQEHLGILWRRLDLSWAWEDSCNFDKWRHLGSTYLPPNKGVTWSTGVGCVGVVRNLVSPSAGERWASLGKLEGLGGMSPCQVEALKAVKESDMKNEDFWKSRQVVFKRKELEREEARRVRWMRKGQC